MKTLRTVSVVALALLAWGVACAGEQPASKAEAKSGALPQAQPATLATNAAAMPDYPVVGFLESRGRVVTIKAGPKGTLYSIKTTDGKVLCENLSAEQLRAQAPELHDLIKTGVANSSGKSGATDARVRPMADSAMR